MGLKSALRLRPIRMIVTRVCLCFCCCCCCRYYCCCCCFSCCILPTTSDCRYHPGIHRNNNGIDTDVALAVSVNVVANADANAICVRLLHHSSSSCSCSCSGWLGCCCYGGTRGEVEQGTWNGCGLCMHAGERDAQYESAENCANWAHGMVRRRRRMGMRSVGKE